jgi:hypothetical protein
MQNYTSKIILTPITIIYEMASLIIILKFSIFIHIDVFHEKFSRILWKKDKLLERCTFRSAFNEFARMVRVWTCICRRVSAVHEIMKRRALKINKSAVRGLTGTLLYASGFMFR